MTQEEVFSRSEGNAWFRRNKELLLNVKKVDWPTRLLGFLAGKDRIKNVLELGCANGWRLDRLRGVLQADFVGVDASAAAIEDGRKRYAGLVLKQGILSNVPLEREFDLVIVHFVFHWVDRRVLAKSVSEVDRLVRDEGYLLVGDFLPDHPQRRVYHHLANENIFTYKQDYTRVFESLGTYREVVRVTYDHDRASHNLEFSASSSRAVCSILRKSLCSFYPPTE